MKSIIKKTIGLLLIAILSFSLISCSGGGAQSKLSKEYTIEEFLELIAPAEEAWDEATKYATQDEVSSIGNEAFSKALKKIGFKGDENITVSGRLMYPRISGDTVSFYVTTAENAESDNFDFDKARIMLSETDSYGWIVLLKENSNIKVSFDIVKDENGNLYFSSQSKIIAPSKMEFVPDCAVFESDNQLIYGTVVDIYTFTLTEEEIEDEIRKSTGNLFWWYSAMSGSTELIIVEDNDDQQVSVFVDTQYNKDITIGDKIGCLGRAFYLPSGDLPDYFMDCDLYGTYYIFE